MGGQWVSSVSSGWAVSSSGLVVGQPVCLVGGSAVCTRGLGSSVLIQLMLIVYGVREFSDLIVLQIHSN